MRSKSNKALIAATIAYVKSTLANAEGGHDWFHINRVYTTAMEIAKHEDVNQTTVALAALLHDIADPKFHKGDETLGPAMAYKFLSQHEVPKDTINHVVNIITHMSFKNSLEGESFSSPEMRVVQDADRLDAIGAIGIARCFNYGGFKNRPLYDPNIPPLQQMTKAEYKNSSSPTINHFYEKLLKLKYGMHTKTGRQMAAGRHEFMEAFLTQFYSEWEGKS